MADTKNGTELQHVQCVSVEESSHTLSAAVQRFHDRQHSLSRMEAFKEHWKPILWCVYMFFICIMFGYESLVGSVVVGIEQFREDFGYLYEGSYVISASWQCGFSGAFMLGLVIGGLISGSVVGRLGRQRTVLLFYMIDLAGIFLMYFCSNSAQFLGAKILTGIPLGCFSTIAPTYASEMAPLPLRGAITAGMNFAIVLGNTIGYGVERQAGYYSGKSTYRILFATEWGFVGAALLILPFFPESPYWLCAKGKIEKARENISKLHNANYDVEGHLADIQIALAQQYRDQEAQGSMIECFNKDNWKRTLVGAGMFFIQNATGTAWVIGYMSYFMELAGMSDDSAFNATVGISGAMVVGNMTGWYLVEYLGRRGTMLYGTVILTITLLIIGILAVVNTSGSGALVAQVVFMGIWGFVYQATAGSAAWPIASENATSRLRNMSQSICTITNGLSAAIWGLSLPYAVNPNEGHLQGKVAFIFAAILVLSVVFIYFFVPETKGRTYDEIDELWNRGIPARNFSQTVVSRVTDVKEV